MNKKTILTILIAVLIISVAVYAIKPDNVPRGKGHTNNNANNDDGITEENNETEDSGKGQSLRGCYQECREAKLTDRKECGNTYKEERGSCKDEYGSCFDEAKTTYENCKNSDTDKKTCKENYETQKKACRESSKTCKKTASETKKECYSTVKNDDLACKLQCREERDTTTTSSSTSSTTSSTTEETTSTTTSTSTSTTIEGTTTTSTTTSSTTTLPINVTSCIDSDFGLNYLLRGQVNATNSTGASIYWDECTTSLNLREYYCTSNLPAYIYYDCSNEGKQCSLGRCTATTSTTSSSTTSSSIPAFNQTTNSRRRH